MQREHNPRRPVDKQLMHCSSSLYCSMETIGGVVTAEELRGWVYEALRDDSRQRQKNPNRLDLQLSDIELHVKAKLQAGGEMPTGPNSHFMEIPVAYKDLIREIIWGLVIQGLVVPGASTQQASLPQLQVTEWGKKCLEAGEYLPHDAGQYISRVKSQIPDVDNSILLYLQEGLVAFRSGAHLASAVMTGVASEKTLFLLRDAVERALPTEHSKASFASKTTNRQVKPVFGEIWKRLDPVHEKLAADLGRQEVKAELLGTFDLIRKTRNDAGHPTGRQISREEAHNLLLLFPQYCQAAHNTMNWLRDNPLT